MYSKRTLLLAKATRLSVATCANVYPLTLVLNRWQANQTLLVTLTNFVDNNTTQKLYLCGNSQ